MTQVLLVVGRVLLATTVIAAGVSGGLLFYETVLSPRKNDLGQPT
jgi:hypothetical protein